MSPIASIHMFPRGYTKHYHARTDRVCTSFPVQHLQYLAYGDKFVDHKASASGYSERFTFTGKDPRQWWRTPMNNILYSEQRDEETGYTYHGARYYDASLTCSWFSVDPLSDKYPSMSPYNYCAWNPVKLVDPDGREIYYCESGTYYLYKKDSDGSFAFFKVDSQGNSTGEKYDGSNNRYVNNLISSLNELKKGKTGEKLVGFFEGSKGNNVIIRKSDIENSATGTTVRWADHSISNIPIASSANEPIQTIENTPFVALGHELAHVRDTYKGRNLSGKTEGSAMLFENLIRVEHGLIQRTYHGIKNGETDFDSEPAPVFPTNLTWSLWGRYSFF